MMYGAFQNHLRAQLAEIREAGLYKGERVITTPQEAHIATDERDDLLNLCSNNYLGLADHPAVVASAHEALDRWGYGLASVRFICGTQRVHKELERGLSAFLETEDTILYSSCFDANAGLFETLLSAEDAILSDELNHASIIDGVRLCKARRYRYRNRDMADLEAKLEEAAADGARYKMIATDGVFSMDGYVARLGEICDLADEHDALVMVDDSHAVGFMGERGRGTHELCGVMGRVDVLTGTLGKALGGASGGYASGRSEIVEMLRQRSRPYLFSNTLSPTISATSLKVLALLEESTERRDKLEANTRLFRAGMEEHGFDVLRGRHPIVPVMFGDAKLAGEFAEGLLDEGVYVIAFSYPVVPRGRARIRVQVSAAHTEDDVRLAVEAFSSVRAKMGLGG